MASFIGDINKAVIKLPIYSNLHICIAIVMYTAEGRVEIP
jgi:hypothetical protein